MDIIHEELKNDYAFSRRYENFIKRFQVNGLLRSVGASKEKGVSVRLIFAFLFGLVFDHKNLYETMKSKRNMVAFSKNTVYRFLSRATINWEAFIQKLSASVIPEIDKLTSEERKSAFVLDDTPYYRNRSKKVEMLSRCYDHSKNRYYKGFTMLSLGWSDGQTFIPVSFRMLASGNMKNLLVTSSAKNDMRTLATKRRADARTEKPKLALRMLEAAKRMPKQAKYVLFDSWFASPAFMLSVKKLGFEIVARIKNHENYRYIYEGEKLSLSQIYNTNKKRRGQSKYLLSVSAEIQHKDSIESVTAKIVFVRDRSNRKKWIALITTDTNLTEEEVIALYAKRWDIEPFHKVLKSTLQLTKEFQLRSFDSITAHTAIVITRYIFLSVESRESNDDRSIGGLYLLICEELEDISFQYAFELLLAIFKQYFQEIHVLANKYFEQLVQQFIASLPAFIKAKLLMPVWES